MGLVETRLDHAYRTDDRPHEKSEADPAERPHVELRDPFEERIRDRTRLRGKLLGGDALALALLLADGRDLGEIVVLRTFDVRDHRVDLLVDLLSREVVGAADLRHREKHAKKRHKRKHRKVREPRRMHRAVASVEVINYGLEPFDDFLLHIRCPVSHPSATPTA